MGLSLVPTASASPRHRTRHWLLGLPTVTAATAVTHRVQTQHQSRLITLDKMEIAGAGGEAGTWLSFPLKPVDLILFLGSMKLCSIREADSLSVLLCRQGECTQSEGGGAVSERVRSERAGLLRK